MVKQFLPGSLGERHTYETPRAKNMKRKKHRGALQSAELIFILPLLGLVGMGTVQFGLYFMQQQRLQSAVDAAARTAAGDFAYEDDRLAAAQEEFNRVLGNVVWKEDCELQFVPGSGTGSNVEISVSVPATAVLPNLLVWTGLGWTAEDQISAAAVMRRT
jgi:Flp pilus assembly protein TadG